jgi:rubredoxin
VRPSIELPAALLDLNLPFSAPALGLGPAIAHDEIELGNAVKAELRLIVWCRGCGYQVEPDLAPLAERYGADTPVLDWRERLVCSECGSREVDFVVSVTKR